MGTVRQNPIQRTVSLFICVCIALCTIVAHNIAQNRPDNFPSYPPDNHKSQQKLVISYSQGTESTTKNQPGIDWVHALADILHSALWCHSNETRATIANPPSSEGQTHRHVWPICISPWLRLTRNVTTTSHGSHETRCWPITRIFSFLVLHVNCLQ